MNCAGPVLGFAVVWGVADVGPRAREILLALCRDYVVRGQPVSSRALHEGHGLAWSPATIRNELKGLESAGLVHQPHSAAGRVPTASGLRIFVDELGALQGVGPDARVQQVFAASLSGARDAGRRLASTTRLLSELSGCVAIGFFGQPRAPVVGKVELIAVGPGRALLVTTTRKGARHVKRVDIDTELVRNVDELDRLADQLGDLVNGQTLTQARKQLLQLVREQEAHLDAFLATAVKLGLVLCAGLALDPLWLQISGQPTLASMPAEQEGALARTLATLEDFHRLAHLLCQLLPAGRSAPSVQLGLDPELVAPQAGAGVAGLSLVGCRVAPGLARAMSGAETGVVALLGPSRMDYARLIPLVEFAARAVAERG